MNESPIERRGRRGRAPGELGSGAARRPAILALAAALASGAGAGPAAAAELYRWVEPDGSITFSPNRPPPGVAFETVDAGGGDGGAPARPAATPPVPSPAAPVVAATPSPVATPREAPRDLTATAPTRPRAGSVAGLAYAPPPLGAATVAPPAAPPPGDVAATDSAHGAAADGAPSDIDAARRGQCRELEKRVISLERSLMDEMTPELMDRTVLTMARYQSSFDDHCRR